MIKIEVLGSGCSKCKILELVVRKVIEEEKVKAEIVKVTEINQIIDRGVMMTPALIINGKIVSTGKIPSNNEIRKWIKQK